MESIKVWPHYNSTLYRLLRIYLVLVSLLFACQSVYSQNTVGTLYNSVNAMDGYTFFSPFSGTKAYMIDNCGRLVNEWDRGTRPGLSAYFLENGHMLRTYKIPPIGPFTSASNGGGIEIVDWDNNLIWSYEINTTSTLSHHDVVYMPNGNILVLVWDIISAEKLIALGRDPNEISNMGFAWSERIIELKPIGDREVELVWEWRIKDHYIQDFDDGQNNFGVVSDHPELFDINLPDINSSDSHSYADYNHFNSIDYNATLDLILISVRNSDEVWVIDHSTTISEAAGHRGGSFNKGGDLLYRWGNPSSYKRGEPSDQMLFGQHGANWIIDPESGKQSILVFNNGNGRPGPDYSTVEIIILPLNGYEFSIESDEAYSPNNANIIYGEVSSQRKQSPFLSNAQLLSNGHYLINYGSLGNLIEIVPWGPRVWEYEIPLAGDFPANQGQSPSNNASFRAYKYPMDYKGFENIDVVAGPTIESGTDIETCEMITNIEEENESESATSYYDPNTQNLSITVDPVYGPYTISLFSMKGKMIRTEMYHNSKVINLQSYPNGLYCGILYSTQINTSFTFKFIKI